MTDQNEYQDTQADQDWESSLPNSQVVPTPTPPVEEVVSADDTPPPVQSKPLKKSATQLAAEIHAGYWGNDPDAQASALDESGFNGQRVVELAGKGVGRIRAEQLPKLSS